MSDGSGRREMRDVPATSATTIDYAHEVRAHDSIIVRWMFAALGTLCVILGVIGVVVPVLPTTPFMLLAAACYARASVRFYNWLLNSRAFGPLILEWRRHHSIPWKTKLSAIALMSITLTASIVFFVRNPYTQGVLALLGIGLAIWLYRVPSRDRA
jgi:uncharacterized membrane protein YbaN (DUF454 family)